MFFYRVLKVASQVLEKNNWSSRPKVGRAADEDAHAPFLQVVLTCIRELDAECKDKKDKSDKEEQKEALLQSLHTQVINYLSDLTNAN